MFVGMLMMEGLRVLVKMKVNGRVGGSGRTRSW